MISGYTVERYSVAQRVIKEVCEKYYHIEIVPREKTASNGSHSGLEREREREREKVYTYGKF